MTNTVNSTEQLDGCLHYDPAAYWCPDCWDFKTDCEHLAPPLTTKLVPVDDWLIRAVRYDRDRQILEVQLHAGGTYQHYGVPLNLALKLVKADRPANIFNEAINGRFRFERVRLSRA